MQSYSPNTQGISTIRNETLKYTLRLSSITRPADKDARSCFSPGGSSLNSKITVNLFFAHCLMFVHHLNEDRQMGDVIRKVRLYIASGHSRSLYIRPLVAW